MPILAPRTLRDGTNSFGDAAAAANNPSVTQVAPMPDPTNGLKGPPSPGIARAMATPQPTPGGSDPTASYSKAPLQPGGGLMPSENTPAATPHPFQPGGLNDLGAGASAIGANFMPNARQAWNDGTADMNSATNDASRLGLGVRRTMSTAIGAADDIFRTPYNKFVAPLGQAAVGTVANTIVPGAAIAMNAATSGENQPTAATLGGSAAAAIAAARAASQPPAATPAAAPAAPAAAPAAPAASSDAAPYTGNPNAAPAQPNAVAPQPVLDSPTQSALSGAMSDAAGRVDPGVHNADGFGGSASLGNGGAFGFGNVADSTAQSNSNERNYLLREGMNSTNGGIRNASAAAYGRGDEIASQLQGQQSQERVAGLREQGDLQRAIAANTNNRFINSQNNVTAQRGQDTTLAGRQMMNQMTMNRMQLEQFNKNRSYNMDVAKYGTDVAQKNLAASDAAQKATQSNLENTFRTTDSKGNSVPDADKIGAYNNAAATTVPALINKLRGSGDPQAVQHAQELEKRDGAALTPSDHARLLQLFNTREALRGDRSHLPGGAEFNDSDNLLNFEQAPGSAGIQRNTLTPNRVRFVGGSSATPNDLSIQGGANAFLPDFGKVRNDNLMRGIRRPE